MNIDVNPLYTPSLQKIKDVIGGDYVIGAATDYDGTIEMSFSENPYWTSMRPENDLYWTRINENRQVKSTVPAMMLDTIADQFALRAPYFLRLDVQGAEVLALKGAKKLLSKTRVVLCECDIEDFAGIHAVLTKNKFRLFDLPDLCYVNDGPGELLGWFYAIYIADGLSGLMPKSFFDASQHDEIKAMQGIQRQERLVAIDQYLEQVKSTAISRSGPCPCGSGKKFKRCCG